MTRKNFKVFEHIGGFNSPNKRITKNIKNKRYMLIDKNYSKTSSEYSTKNLKKKHFVIVRKKSVYDNKNKKWTAYETWVRIDKKDPKWMRNTKKSKR